MLNAMPVFACLHPKVVLKICGAYEHTFLKRVFQSFFCPKYSTYMAGESVFRFSFHLHHVSDAAIPNSSLGIPNENEKSYAIPFTIIIIIIIMIFIVAIVFVVFVGVVVVVIITLNICAYNNNIQTLCYLKLSFLSFVIVA